MSKMVRHSKIKSEHYMREHTLAEVREDSLPYWWPDNFTGCFEDDWFCVVRHRHRSSFKLIFNSPTEKVLAGTKWVTLKEIKNVLKELGFIDHLELVK